MPKSILKDGWIDLELLEFYDEEIKNYIGEKNVEVKTEITESIDEKVNDAISEKLDDGAIQEKVGEAVDEAIETKFKRANKADIENMFEAVKVNIVQMDDEDAQLELGGKHLGDLVGEDFSATLSNNQITATGTINKIEGWSEAFPQESQKTDYYIPLILTGVKGSVVKVNLLGGGTKDNVFGETGDGDNWMALVLAVEEAEPTRTFTVYNDGDEEDGREITVDASSCTFAQ